MNKLKALCEEETIISLNYDKDDFEKFGVKDLTLRDYQIAGVNWLLSRITKYKHGAILSDEMGLGKTCQTITCITSLQSKFKKSQFLIVSPLSVINNWKEEFKRFSPNLEVIVYAGDKETRAELRNLTKDNNFHVLLTNFELCLQDEAFFTKFKWDLLVVDEGHRLKNSQSLLHQMLFELASPVKLILTGTPIQNNLNELYSLLRFVAPKVFTKTLNEDFIENYSKGDSSKKDDLTAILRPFVLRRTKEEVLKDLPKKSEVVLFHGLSELQKKYYKTILLKDQEAFSQNQKNSLMNVLMQLRKCVAHPYLFNGVEPEPFEIGEHLITASDKLVLIDKLLQHLKKHGHKVLLFSQMTRMLDILQDYLAYREYNYERLDGSVRGEERYLAVKNFNKDQDNFVFLLSTKAGGQGLNLVGADTVIFVDSDFNPQNDLQAAARAHRIGQERPVKVIRLIGQHTVEEIILRRSTAKLKLSNEVIEGGQFGLGVDQKATLAQNAKEMKDILKFGVNKLFEQLDESQSAQSANIDFDGLLGESEDGKWIDLSTIDEHFQEKDAEEENANHMYIFEGKDYSKETSDDDKQAFEKLVDSISKLSPDEEYLLRKKTPGVSQHVKLDDLPTRRPRKKLSPEELIARKKKREENMAKRRVEEEKEEILRAQRRKEKLQKKWTAANYTSHSVELSGSSSSDEGEDAEFNDSEEEANDSGGAASRRPLSIHYVMGDATRPDITDKTDAIICHCLDDSGRWGRGGLFHAISNRSPTPEQVYTQAGKMFDLGLGDAHLVPCDDVTSRSTGRDFVALLVSQTRDRKGNLSGIKMSALDMALKKLRKEAVKKNASVHMPRIGYNTPNFNWYAVERLIRKNLSSKGVPVYIYYFSRKKPANSSRVHTNSDNEKESKKRKLDEISDSDISDTETKTINTTNSEAKRSKLVIESDESDSGDVKPNIKRKLKDISDSESSGPEEEITRDKTEVVLPGDSGILD